MRVLLDTQVFIMAATENWPTLPKRVQALLSDAEDERILSTVSLVEIAIKNSIGKLNLSMGDMNKSITDMLLTVLPFTSAHAYQMFGLPLHHRVSQR